MGEGVHELVVPLDEVEVVHVGVGVAGLPLPPLQLKVHTSIIIFIRSTQQLRRIRPSPKAVVMKLGVLGRTVLYKAMKAG